MDVVVDAIEIRKKATLLKSYSDSLEDEIVKIKNIVSNISASWSGDDAVKYVDVLQEKYILGLNELKQIIDDYAIYLNNIPEAYEILDNVFSDKHIEV